MPAPVRPWPEVKSRREAPKRIPSEGFAGPKQQCPSFGITDAHLQARVGDGKHGRAEQIQTFRGSACHSTFTCRRNTPLYRLKPPSQQIAIVLSALAEGIDPSSAERVFGYRQATITTWLTRAGVHAHALHEHFFFHFHLPHLKLDELCTRLRCAKPVRLSLAGHRSLHQASSRPPVGSPHAAYGASAHPRSAAELGHWLSPTLYE